MPVSYGEWLFSVCLLVTYQVCLCVSCPSLPCRLWIRFGEKSPTSSGRQSPHPTAFPSCLALDRLPWTTPLQPCVVSPRSPVVRTGSVLGSAWPWTWEPGRVWTHPWVLGKFPWRHPAGKLFLGHGWCSASADHGPKATMGRRFLDWVSVTAELFPDLSFVCVVWKHDVSIWTGTILGLNFLVLPASSHSGFSTLEVAVASLECRSCLGAPDGSDGQWRLSTLTVFPFSRPKVLATASWDFYDHLENVAFSSIPFLSCISQFVL